MCWLHRLGSFYSELMVSFLGTSSQEHLWAGWAGLRLPAASLLPQGGWGSICLSGQEQRCGQWSSHWTQLCLWGLFTLHLLPSVALKEQGSRDTAQEADPKMFQEFPCPGREYQQCQLSCPKDPQKTFLRWLLKSSKRKKKKKQPLSSACSFLQQQTKIPVTSKSLCAFLV